jgi:hypothetical protein
VKRAFYQPAGHPEQGEKHRDVRFPALPVLDRAVIRQTEDPVPTRIQKCPLVAWLNAATPMHVVGTMGLLVLALTAGCTRGDERALSVVISLPDQHVPLASKATITVDYTGTGARLVTEEDQPACAFTLPGVDGRFSDDRQGVLTIHANGSRATRGPADLAACRMKASDASTTAAELASRLIVRVEGAEDAAGKPIDLAADGAARYGSARGAGMKEDEIDLAQARAVKAAATITQAAREEAAAQRAATAAASVGDRTGAAAGDAVAVPTAFGAATAPPAAERLAEHGDVARPVRAAVPGGPAPTVADDSAMPGGDRDPSYDDSAADDDTIASYSLDFFVQTRGTFGALQLDVEHLGSSGGFIGRGADVDCVSLNKNLDVNVLVASNYLGERLTRIGLISLEGVVTPAPVVRCGFRTRETLTPGSFLVEVKDASDTGSNPIEPAPRVFVSAITPRR